MNDTEQKLDQWNRERSEANSDNVPGQAYRALQAKLARAVALLRELEWHHGECLACDGGRYAREHAADCDLAAFLKETAS